MAIGLALPFSPVGGYLGFRALPPLYWPLLAATAPGERRLGCSIERGFSAPALHR
jgi:hypothetical protein